MCVLIALVVGPLLEETFDRLSKRFLERDINIFGYELFVPGVRITLWLAGSHNAYRRVNRYYFSSVRSKN